MKASGQYKSISNQPNDLLIIQNNDLEIDRPCLSQRRKLARLGVVCISISGNSVECEGNDSSLMQIPIGISSKAILLNFIFLIGNDQIFWKRFALKLVDTLTIPLYKFRPICIVMQH